MPDSVAIVGAGVSGLTCAVVLAERGYQTAIFAEETGQRTTSAVAAAIWYPYDAEPIDKVIAWALETYHVLVDLSRKPNTGVSMIELRTFSRGADIQIPEWASPLGARRIEPSVLTGLRPVPHRPQRGGYNFVRSSEDTSPVRSETSLPVFSSGFRMNVPLTDTTIYLDYLKNRFLDAGGGINPNVRFETLENVSPEFDLVINCSGIGAKLLIPDAELEPHRGQVAIVSKIDLPGAVVCDDLPLMYAIPRAHDCVFGGTNELSDNYEPDPAMTSRIVAECSRVLDVPAPKILAERVGLRPFRKSGVCLRADRLRDGRSVIHNYGHGGSGFTLSWGCAQQVFDFAQTIRTSDL
jgi:D-amino-acid oxidase